MRITHTRFYPVIAIALLLVGTTFSQSVAEEVKKEQKPRSSIELKTKPLADITFFDGEGKERHLSEFKGKVVLINLWATWCAPCVEEMPALSKLQADYEQQNLVVLPISEDNGDRQKVEDFYKKAAISNLPVYFDQKMQNFKQLGAVGLPISILVNTKGEQVARLSGYIDWQEDSVQSMIKAVLAEK